ncbi:conserved hypothetical protein [Pediculus humanus corporis]|uniref:C3H1-type domain-containing protein n=1 Tax=Pediculus humanus subsp. corporis TaxID=121224 RepID=E0VBD0_PEDHC|nr:uncharacterized protein Phum_PHUM058130 [Pediculus humanus corporis]EEB10686.1 conserved hypothetical protein [Pediculus humanus corporis]
MGAALKKYYCDFCNRYFNDDKNTRAKHESSVSHINLKKEHYNMFRDPETILKEETVKKPCRKFHNEGFCSFGGSCTFSHYSQEDLDKIRQEIFISNSFNFDNLTIEDWLVKYNRELEEKNIKNNKLLWSSELPPELLLNAQLLPPSLLPFPIKNIIDIDLETWG